MMNILPWPDKFGLTRNPFKDTLDTTLFYRTRQHEEALVKLRLGIYDRHALILLSGDSGTGKTIVSQAALRSLGAADVLPVFVFVHPGMGKGPLLGAILKELEVEKIARYTGDRLAQLQDAALGFYSKGQRIVVVIDEAHFLKADALHILRTLSNLETEQEKLITVILVAERSLTRRLSAPSYASLRSRITFGINLDPLTPEEAEQYVKFRLLKCGATTDLIPGDAFKVLHKLSGGIPREINRLLYNSFMEAMSGDNSLVNTDILMKADRKIGVVNG
ncbi:MAG: AAA family ATPase [Proteobacteria bacterium]|nr:AAA family ATPase [Pseudomonadota bacterium]MBU1710592.1 AAA family ATPase [Pseudomonadota bacterium]